MVQFKNGDNRYSLKYIVTIQYLADKTGKKLFNSPVRENVICPDAKKKGKKKMNRTMFRKAKKRPYLP